MHKHSDIRQIALSIYYVAWCLKQQCATRRLLSREVEILCKFLVDGDSLSE